MYGEWVLYSAMYTCSGSAELSPLSHAKASPAGSPPHSPTNGDYIYFYQGESTLSSLSMIKISHGSSLPLLYSL